MSARSFAKVKIGWVFSDCFRRKGFVTFAAFFLPVFQNNAHLCAQKREYHYEEDYDYRRRAAQRHEHRRHGAGLVEGAHEGGAEVKVVRLYDIDYKGCRSCMACQLKDKRVPSCRFKDGITDILAECAEADGLVLASPIYYGEFTAQMRAFYECLTFPWLSYKDFSIVAPKKMPVTMIYTMNASPEQAPGTLQNMKGVEAVLGMSFGNTPEVIMANNTTQVNDYSRYHFADGTAAGFS